MACTPALPRLRTPLMTALLALGPALAAGPASRTASDEEYQVLRAYLASPYAEKGERILFEKIGIFFIYNVNPKDSGNIVRFFKEYAGTSLDPDLAKRFAAINRFPVPIDRRRFPEDTKYSSQFIRKGVYSLSRVGFNAKGDEALLYATFSSLMEDGHGSLVWLKQTGGAWTVAKATAVWMFGAAVHPFNPIGKAP